MEVMDMKEMLKTKIKSLTRYLHVRKCVSVYMKLVVDSTLNTQTVSIAGCEIVRKKKFLHKMNSVKIVRYVCA